MLLVAYMNVPCNEAQVPGKTCCLAVNESTPLEWPPMLLCTLSLNNKTYHHFRDESGISINESHQTLLRTAFKKLGVQENAT